MADSLARLWIPAPQPGPFGRLHAATKLALGALLALWVVLVDHPLALALPVALVGLAAAGERLNRQQQQLFWGGALLVLWTTLLSQGLFYQRVPREAIFTLIPPQPDALWPFEGLRLYREGLLYGAVQSCRLLAVLWLGLLITFTTEFHALLGGLVAWRIPAGLGLLALIAARSLPALATEALGVQQALRVRHLRLRDVGIGGVLRPIVVGALRRAATLAASLQVRGIDPAAPRLGTPTPLPLQDRWGLSLLLLGIVGVLGLRLLLFLYQQGWWYAPEWLPLYRLAALMSRGI